MKNKQIIQELNRIREGIEGDRYTWENITDLIKKLQKYEPTKSKTVTP